jgi:Ca2+-binding RTX toxin-like protein
MHSRLSRFTAVGAALLALTVIAPAAALADATVAYVQLSSSSVANLIYAVDAADTAGGLTSVTKSGSTYTFHGSPFHVTAGSGCSAVDASTVTCPSAIGVSTVNAITILGAQGPDTVAVDVPSSLKVSVDAADGDDTISTGDSTDSLNGGKGSDSLAGGSGPDVLSGGDGADKLFGANGADTLKGEGGADELHGSDGKDSLDGGNKADKLYGENGDDTLHGRDGADYLKGGAGDDVLHGDAGADHVHGNNGKDKIHGDGGNDTLTSKDSTIDSVFCGSGTDTVTKADSNDLFSACETVP